MYGEVLKAVSFFSATAGEEYKIEIYTDVKEHPEDGTLQEAATTVGTIPFAGHYTIKLNENVEMEPNTRFSVVVTTKESSILSDDSYLPDREEGVSSFPMTWAAENM